MKSVKNEYKLVYDLEVYIYMGNNGVHLWQEVLMKGQIKRAIVGPEEGLE